MKKVFLNIVFLLYVATFGANCQTNTSGLQKQNEEPLFRMIKVSVPDSVVFTMAQGKEVEGISVSLVSGEQSFVGVARGSGMMGYRDGKMYITDQTIITVKEFHTPAGFKAQKIKFDIGDKVVYHDIAVSTQPAQPAAQQVQPAVQQTQPAAVQQTQPAAQKVQPEVIFVQQKKPLTQNEKFRRWYAEIGLYVGILMPESNDKTLAPVGGDFGFGFHITPHNRLSFDMGFGTHGRKIGTFNYTKTYTDGKKENFTDGVIYRDYSSFSFLLSYHYVFTPSEKINVRLGASFGTLNLTGSFRFDPKPDDLPKLEEKDADMLVYGIGSGLIWNFGKRCFIDVGYRILANDGLELDNFKITAPAHQFNLIFGFRF